MGRRRTESRDALGIIETRTVAATIGAADAGIGHIVHFTFFDDLRGRTSSAERDRRSGSAHSTVSTVAELAAELGI